MVEFFNKICCICLETKVELLNICNKDNNEESYYTKLKSLLPNLGWSKKFQLCPTCITKLDCCLEFFKLCTDTDSTRKDNLPLSEALELDEIQVEKVENSLDFEEFKCDLCNKEFKQAKSLKLHNTRIHKSLKQTEVNIEEEQPLEEVKKEESLLDVKPDLLINCSEVTNKTDDVKVDDLDVFKDFPEFDSPDNCNDSDFDIGASVDIKKEGKERRKKNKVKKERKPRTKIQLPVTCEYCRKDFNRKQHLLAHIRCLHTFEKPYSCDQCDAKFSVSHSLLVHKRRHNDDRRYVCTYCGKKFLCSTDLVHHTKIHLNKREYKCEPCNKSFNTISVLQIHKKCVHTDPSLWKHICSYCDRKFPIKSSLTAHLRRHTGEKNFSCTICGKSFYDKKMVENHYRSHTDERLFKCHLCEKDYKDRGGLNLHLKKVHDVGNATIPPPPPKKFGCHLCPKAFSSRGKLQKHICTHTGEKMFNCHLCDKKFNDSWYKKMHLQRKHNVNPTDEEMKNGVNANVPVIIPVNVIHGNLPNTVLAGDMRSHPSPLEPTTLHQLSPVPPNQGVMPGSLQSPMQQYNVQYQTNIGQQIITQQPMLSSGHAASPYN